MLTINKDGVIDKIVSQRLARELGFLRNLLILSVISFLCIMVWSHFKLTEVKDPVLQRKFVDELVIYHSITTSFMGFILFVFSREK